MDGLLHVLAHHAFAGVIGPVLSSPAEGQERRIQGRRHLGGAGGLGAVAENAADTGQGVGNGIRHHPIVSPVQIGQGRTGAAGCRHRSAKSGQVPNVVFQVDGHQIAHRQRPVQLFLRIVLGTGIDDHRHGYGNALVAPDCSPPAPGTAFPPNSAGHGHRRSPARIR